jgi:anti-anti-sigma factor
MEGRPVDQLSLDRVVVVTLDTEIDLTNAVVMRDQLRSVVVAGVKVVIADMTETAFGDTSCFRNLLIADEHARASGAQLRLVIRADAVRRVLTALGFDRLLCVYPSLGAAQADDGGCRGAAFGNALPGPAPLRPRTFRHAAAEPGWRGRPAAARRDRRRDCRTSGRLGAALLHVLRRHRAGRERGGKRGIISGAQEY